MAKTAIAHLLQCRRVLEQRAQVAGVEVILVVREVVPQAGLAVLHQDKRVSDVILPHVAEGRRAA